MRAQAHHDRIAAAVNNDFEGGVSCPTCAAPPGEACVFGPRRFQEAIEELRQAEELAETTSGQDDPPSKVGAMIARARAQLVGLFSSDDDEPVSE